ncbi:hypothetical protein ACFLR4_01340 [Bacteroidota bacterium]
MDFVNKFIADFMRLPETFNELSEQKSTFNYYKAFYNTWVRAPYGEKYLSESPVKGFHFNLTIILEPISEEGEILNNIATFTIDDSVIRNIKFVVDGNVKNIEDLKLTEDNCIKFFAELEKFCQDPLSG